MITFLSSWIEQIAIAIIIASIFELILPRGNLKKYIKLVLGIYVVFCIISPFVNSSDLFDFKDINKYIETSEIAVNEQVNQTSMDLRLEQLYIQEIEKNIDDLVEKYGYDVEKCNVDADLDQSSTNAGIHNINLVIKQKGIVDIETVEINVGEKEDFDKEETTQFAETIKEEIAKNYEIDKDIIKVKIKK